MAIRTAHTGDRDLRAFKLDVSGLAMITVSAIDYGWININGGSGHNPFNTLPNFW